MITEEMKERLRELGPAAVDVMGEMLRDQDTPPMTRAHLIDVVLEYTLGKPEMALKIQQEIRTPDSSLRIGSLMGEMKTKVTRALTEEAEEETEETEEAEEAAETEKAEEAKETERREAAEDEGACENSGREGNHPQKGEESELYHVSDRTGVQSGDEDDPDAPG